MKYLNTYKLFEAINWFKINPARGYSGQSGYIWSEKARKRYNDQITGNRSDREHIMLNADMSVGIYKEEQTYNSSLGLQINGITQIREFLNIPLVDVAYFGAKDGFLQHFKCVDSKLFIVTHVDDYVYDPDNFVPAEYKAKEVKRFPTREENLRDENYNGDATWSTNVNFYQKGNIKFVTSSLMGMPMVIIDKKNIHSLLHGIEDYQYHSFEEFNKEINYILSIAEDEGLYVRTPRFTRNVGGGVTPNDKNSIVYIMHDENDDDDEFLRIFKDVSDRMTQFNNDYNYTPPEENFVDIRTYNPDDPHYTVTKTVEELDGLVLTDIEDYARIDRGVIFTPPRRIT